ncbi:serine-rich adhesin for platelets [Stomoxys calcitrans]|uniref:serine-rich adhesin for platelets n=1 Tax=Stomoxys calcitrans TaxID=35570 RepID=UPI0027E3AFD8|nr:serine-rich adhesin for platelets [Stomoxys calcitrans]
MKESEIACLKMSSKWVLIVTLNLILGELTVSHAATLTPSPVPAFSQEELTTMHSTSELVGETPSSQPPTGLTAEIKLQRDDDLLFVATTTAKRTTDNAVSDKATTGAATGSDLNTTPIIFVASSVAETGTGAPASTPLEESVATAAESTATTTLASSNAPATTITAAAGEDEEGEASSSPLPSHRTVNSEVTIAAIQEQMNSGEKEIKDQSKESTAKESLEMRQQITATTMKPTEQQQQTFATPGSWLKEADMQQQATANGNAEILNIHDKREMTAATTNTEAIASSATDNEKGETTTLPVLEQQSNSPAPALVLHTPKEVKNDDDKKPAKEIVIDSIQFAYIATSDSPTLTPMTSTPQLALAKTENQKSLDDFKPLIQEANNKLLLERTIFTPKHKDEEQEWKQNLMPNEVQHYGSKGKESKKYLGQPYEHNINWSPYLHPATPVVDFTGKVLQEEDGVITEIEEKFQLKEFATDMAVDKKSDATTEQQPTDTPPRPMEKKKVVKLMPKPHLHLVNHEKPSKSHAATSAPAAQLAAVVMRPVEFIERRVKKSFDFPMHRIASDAGHAMQHFDFANTKFSSNINEPRQHLSAATAEGDKYPRGSEPMAGSGGVAVNQGHDTMAGMHVPRTQPEFSTTKFYNSKELYNEMLLHKSKQSQQQLHNTEQQQPHDKAKDNNGNSLNGEVVAPSSSLTLNSFAVLHSPKIAKLEEMHELREQPQKSLAIKRVTVQATKHKENSSGDTIETAATSTSSTTQNPKTSSASTTTTTSTSTSTSTTRTTTSQGSTTSRSNTNIELPMKTTTKKFHKEFKKAKLLIKSMLPSTNSIKASEESNANINTNANTMRTKSPASLSVSTITPAAADATSTMPYTTNPLGLTTAKPLEVYKAESRSNALTSSPNAMSAAGLTPFAFSSSSSNSRKAEASSSASILPIYDIAQTSRPTAISTNPTKAPLKPIVRPRILSRLQEKINSLECEISNVPQDSHLWRGNETHELLLPIMTPENCKTDKDCTAMMVSWEGEAEIQSGDILIVEINDALLNPKDVNLTTSAHNTQVYQVTRSGHEHCDVTEGILLDITPLIVDGRKLVTLYDKDLTEGVNLLIVVSELWGSQCVRLKVTTKTENCGESADCSGKGVCFSNGDMEEYECQCCSGFAGPHCEEIDACTPSPCTNNGICVDLSQGHEGNSYQCLCPYGYTGKNCQYELDPCNPAECMNGGSCVGNSTHFRCECTPGFTGPLCQHVLNECESSPCIHGICVDQEDGFRCFCQPGFAGELCNFEYNECESNPCQNGGECIDHIGSFECRCSKGYTGTRCHIKVDFCANKPCPEGRRCIDHGNDYSCECLGGRNGPECNEMLRTQCNVNPCTHGGTCWSSGDSFYCACRPGYTGTMCEDEFVVETVVSSSEFMVDDTSARNFNDKSFGSSVVLKSPIELHNAYTAAIVLALVIFFVALYLTICHCKVNQTYRKFSTRTYGFLPILGFRWRTKQATSKISRHWLSGKGLGGVAANAMRGGSGIAANSSLSAPLQRNNVGHLPAANASSTSTGHQQQQQHHHQQKQQQQQHHIGQLNERPFQRHLAMNLENDMYYTVDFSENSQHSPLIQ